MNASQNARPTMMLMSTRAQRKRSICRSISPRISTVIRFSVSDDPTMRTIFRR